MNISSNKALHLTAIPLRSKAAGELGRYAFKKLSALERKMKIMKNTEIFDRSYAYCNLQYGDPALLSCIIEQVTELANTKDWGLIEKYLDIDDDPLFLLNRALLVAHCASQKGFDKSTIENTLESDSLLNKWANSLSKLFLRIVQQTKDYDYLVQQILNYENFLFYEMRLTPERKQIACKIYDLRGIDFFLIHYMGGTNNSTQRRRTLG